MNGLWVKKGNEELENEKKQRVARNSQGKCDGKTWTLFV